MTASLRAKIFTKTSDGLLRALNNTRAVAFLVDIHEGVLRKDLMHDGNLRGTEAAIARHTEKRPQSADTTSTLQLRKAADSDVLEFPVSEACFGSVQAAS